MTAKKKANNKRTQQKTMKRTVTTKVIQDLRLLADQIGNIIPATAYRKNGFCFKTISDSYGLKKYWPKQGSKKELIFGFLKGVYKNHPRQFYKIFRENLAQGIERRHKAGDPVLEEEISRLDETLKNLKVNLSKEIRELNLPKERPKIVPPPHSVKLMVDELGLHSSLLPECSSMFKDGYINKSIHTALEKYEVYVQKKSSIQDGGKTLMAKAFDPDNPLVAVADVGTSRGHGIQDGFKFLSMGSMAFWRNFTSHGDEDQIPHHEAIAILATVSHLMHYIDSNEVINI